MKLTKKLLLAAAVMMAASFGFMGCGEEEGDSIHGEEVLVENTTGTATLRSYKSTPLKHLGTLARVELRNQSVTTKDDGSDATGVVGLIWDLKKASKAADKYTDYSAEDVTISADGVSSDTLNFFIIGLRNGGKDHKGKINYYVSKFYNVSSVNKFNFGAGDETTESTTGYEVDNDAAGLAAYASEGGNAEKAYELDVTNKIKNQSFVDIADTSEYLSSDGTIYAWVDIYPANRRGVFKKYGLHYDDYADAAKTGEFIVDIYLGNADFEPTSESTPDATIEIGTDYTGYTKDIAQAKTAKYGAAYAGKTMSGYIKYEEQYKEAEVIEDAE